ncbi:aldo/keto reductase [Arthrobacter oryzae]|uniref:Aryl-alcohol dehydrogenase-like predicted oxidoreductase n=1 Tax=Arthrobacter oryzae TaxID=409290 RepID=A0A495FM24_9MICC|nr:aldo/keto reductase [Arthrobacter oryzae]RKR30294.1 aryl-alcohol dehydrogenase-like predicted oxidoreductase [Arthrobacter oryzae]
MQQRYVGNSGLRVSALSLGTMSWARETEEQDAAALLRAFVDGGGTLIDTAASYADGQAEAMLGGMLGDVVARSEVVISTKAGLTTTDGRRGVDTSRNGMLSGLDASLARLGTDYVDLWFAHAWDPNVPLEETLSALDYAVRSGRARYVGVSNFNGWQTAKAAAIAGFPLVANQSEYSLLQRGAELELIPAIEDAGLGLIAWGPMGRGVLTGKYRGHIPADSRAAQQRLATYVEPYLEAPASSVVEAVAMAAKGLGRTPLDVSLSWLLSQHGVATAVVGARTPVQLKEILDSTLAPLPPEIAQALEDVSDPA